MPDDLARRDERLFDQVAKGMGDREMNLLDHYRLIHRRNQHVIAVVQGLPLLPVSRP